MAQRSSHVLKSLALLLLLASSLNVETTIYASANVSESRSSMFVSGSNSTVDNVINYPFDGRNVTIDRLLWATMNYNDGDVPSGYYQPGSKIEIQFEAFNYNHTNDTELNFSLVEIKPENRTIVMETKYTHTWLYDVSWAFTLPTKFTAQYMLNITASSLPGEVYVGSIRSIITVPGQDIKGSLELSIQQGSKPSYDLTLRNTGENVWVFNPYDYHLEKMHLNQWNRVDLGAILLPLRYMPPGNFSEQIHLPELFGGRYRVSIDLSALGVAGDRTLYYEFSIEGDQTDTLLFDATPIVVSLFLIAVCILYFYHRRSRLQL